ncbi:MAG: hypothetical protein ABFC67_02895 [Mizugakiibacter sp.]|uniref:GFA family protein n=1 Tax=Mizugakiibacter sp. TaxID=1972610 RepID=UPI0027F8DF1A|nr:hypothetical protein [Actinomycetes bacterium]
MLITGRCHCGNIAFTLDWTPEPAEIASRACTCSFCTRHGGVWTSCPAGSLEVRVRDAAHVSKYAFGTRTAEFHVCAVCGVVPVATSRIDGRLYAVVNVNTFEGVAPALLSRSPVSHEGEASDDRLARRKRNWIARVAYTGGG